MLTDVGHQKPYEPYLKKCKIWLKSSEYKKGICKLICFQYKTLYVRFQHSEFLQQSYKH